MNVSPFLKWVGGKRWLVKTKGEIFNIKYDKYIEPFLGSAAVFFHMLPGISILSDTNKNLIDLYRAIQLDWEQVYEKLKIHSVMHSSNYYYYIRNLNFSDIYSRAAQFLYLNRTCWNGIYRVNTRGVFNVPKGTKDKVILKTDNLELVSKYLKNSILLNCDFEKTIKMANRNDLIFIDPPYTANHNNNGFLKYNEKIFCWDDQIRLYKSIKMANERGAKIILTNADHVSIRELYEKYFKIESISRSSVLSGKPEFRRKVSELLITN